MISHWDKVSASISDKYFGVEKTVSRGYLPLSVECQDLQV